MKRIFVIIITALCFSACAHAQEVPHLVIDESVSGTSTLVTSYVECKATQDDEPNLLIGFSFVRPLGMPARLFINVMYRKTRADAAIITGGRCLITKMSGKTIILKQLPNSVGESDDFFDEDGKLSSCLYASYICHDMGGLFDGTDPAKAICFGALPHIYKAEYSEEINPLNTAIVQAIDPIFTALEKRDMYIAEEWMEIY